MGAYPALAGKHADREEGIITSSFEWTSVNTPHTTGPLLGAHMPTAGGLQNAIFGGKEIGCTAVQVFTASPRQWKSSPLKEDTRDAYRTACAECQIDTTVAHDSYLINLAAGPGEILDKSRAAFRDEMERAEELGIKYLVTHMGSHGGAGEDEGLVRLCQSIDALHDELPGYKVRVALETTAGQGTYLGATFEHFPRIFELVKEPERLVVCMDTCHVFSAGYDIRTPAGYEETMQQFERFVGMDKLKVVHANDSMKPYASRADRHAHIGEGEIGLTAFRCLVNDPRIAGLPVIIETPDSETMHAVNLKRLQELVGAPAES